MEDKNKDYALPENDFLAEEPPLAEEILGGMPHLDISAGKTGRIPVEEISAAAPGEDVLLDAEIVPDTAPSQHTTDLAPVIAAASEAVVQEIPEEVPSVFPEEASEQDFLTAPAMVEDFTADEPVSDYDLSQPRTPESVFSEEPFPDEAFRETPAESADFQTSFVMAQPPKEESYEPSGRVRPTRKGRPKRKKGYGLLGIPHLLATLVWLVIIVAIGTSLGRMIWVCAADVLAFGRESSKVTVTITSNDTIEDIAEKLHEAGLVRYPGLFELYAGIAVDEGDIIPGTFEMDTLYDYHALVVQMGPRSSNRTVVTDVLIPEGYNCRQIFALLEEKGICSVEELEAYAANGEFEDFWFLEGVERGDKYCLEGFLFPDTYDFYANSTPREALGKMLSGFNYRFTEEIYAQLPALNEHLSAMMRANGCSEEHISANQLDLQDLLTVASLIEEETSSVLESPTIASVIYNRLTQDLEYERYLGIDAAIIYATGDANHIDTSIDSPYNTYTNAGLTPSPISNPGLDSINAALHPAETNYYYYVLNPETYVHDFSVTLEEHEQKVAKYAEYSAGEEE